MGKAGSDSLPAGADAGGSLFVFFPTLDTERNQEQCSMNDKIQAASLIVPLRYVPGKESEGVK